MQNLQALLQGQKTNSESQSSDPRSFEERQAEWFNQEEGKLNITDGVDCPKCKNKGKFAFAKKIYPDSDIMSMFITECECMKKRKAVRYAQKSGMGELLNLRVNSFKATEEWQKEVKLMIIDYIKNSDGQWLCMLGQSGAGKTHLCSAVANNFLNSGIEVRYCVWGLMTKELKQDMFSPTGTREMLGVLQTVPVLYIDDLFKGSFNDQDVSLIFDLLNYRYNAQLITIITSERLIGELADIDTAIAGRIRERCGKYLAQLTGDNKNYRFKECNND